MSDVHVAVAVRIRIRGSILVRQSRKSNAAMSVERMEILSSISKISLYRIKSLRHNRVPYVADIISFLFRNFTKDHSLRQRV